MNNILLGGPIRIGKSTILAKVRRHVEGPIGGFVTERETSNNIQTFSIKSLSTGQLYPFARINLKNLDKDINKTVFKEVLPDLLTKDLESCKTIFLDELGFMEKDIEEFTSKIYQILDSDLLVLAVVKDFDCEFLNRIRQREDSVYLKVRQDNREFLPSKILQLIRER